MTEAPVTIGELVKAREALIGEIVGKMSADHGLETARTGGRGRAAGRPLELQNPEKMDKEKRAALTERLKKVLQQGERR